VIKPWSRRPILAQDNCTPSCQGSNPFINTGKGVTIFLKGSENSVVNFDCICSLVREELDDYGLFDFRVHRMIRVFWGAGGGNAFL
jgi:hypothetical protein